MINKEEFAQRLLDFLEQKEMNAATLAEKLGIQRSGISHILSGRNNPSLDFVMKFVEAFPEVSFEWLIYGKTNLTTKESKKIVNPTPDLFNQELHSGDNERLTKNKPDIKKNSHKKILKTLLLYDDGSFEVFE